MPQPQRASGADVSLARERPVSTARDQHIVPQLMIRRFAAANGRLLELFKPTLSIGKWRWPKGILYRQDVYRDRAGDLDSELLKRIENKFEQMLGPIADDPLQDKEHSGEVG